MSSELTITQDQTDWTQQQVAALKQLGVSNDVTQADLAIFLTQSKRTGLDPFSRQIYMIGRKQKTANGYETKQTIQVGIDGLRAIAHRVAQQCHEVFSMSDTLWADNSGVWHDVWLSAEPPAAAKVSVKRGGGVFSAVAIFKEYAPVYNGKLSGMWATKPALMIAKCAEALALRKAFPSDMSGIYTDDEMSRAEDVSAPTVVETSAQQQAETTSHSKPLLSTQEQREQILEMLAEAGIHDRLKAINYLKHTAHMPPTKEEADLLIANRETVIRKASAWVREQSTKRTQQQAEQEQAEQQEKEQ
ncbi:phage recombination protein Bet [Gardnerella greenwoodii]|uniref:phage recombination protein Bet n=1 Tax=Gardnerella greenwoodii TaxID=2914925 RepID=UPI0039F136AE